MNLTTLKLSICSSKQHFKRIKIKIGHKQNPEHIKKNYIKKKKNRQQMDKHYMNTIYRRGNPNG